jgi:alkanesulfonate monooxygenase SsuD/methylene tetrahydromethanopterin reductase-like flavin-dependent oxidoreductase (luciferase family)
MPRGVRFGLLTSLAVPWATNVQTWRYLEELGFDSVWDSDHLANPRTVDPGFRLEGWTALAGLAAATSRIRIGILVTHVTYRHPAVLAKQALTVDHISDGRLELGMGPGGAPADHRIVGEPWWPPAERVQRFAEAVQIVDGILRGQLERFEGRYYQVDRPSLAPAAVQQPRPPLTLGVQGPRTLRLAASYADAWSTFGAPDPGPGLAGNLSRSVEEAMAVTKQRNDLLDTYCAEFGRDPATIVRSFVTGCTPDDPWASAEAFADFVGRYREVGINEFILDWPPVRGGSSAVDRSLVEHVATDVIPRLRTQGR